MPAAPDAFASWALQTSLTPLELHSINQMGSGTVPWSELLRSLPGGEVALETPRRIRISWIEALFEAGIQAANRGDDTFARGALGLAMRLVCRRWGPQHPFVDPIASHLSTALYRTGALKQALPLQEALFERLDPNRTPVDSILRVGGMLAQMWLDDGRHHAALDLQRKLFKRAETTLGPQALLTRGLRSDMAATLLKLGQLASALAATEPVEHARPLEVHNIAADAYPIDVVASVNRAAILYEGGQYHQALELEAQAVALLTFRLGPDHRETLIAQNNLALSLKRVGRLHEAEAIQARACEQGISCYGVESPTGALLLANYLYTLAEQGKAEAALPLAARVLPQLSNLSILGAKQLRLCMLCAWAATEVLAKPEASTPQRLLATDIAESFPMLSRALSETAEVLDLSEQKSAPLRDFEQFHEQWARFAVLSGRESLSNAVAALHGLDSWATLLLQTAPVMGGITAPARAEFAAARTALVELNALASCDRIGAKTNAGIDNDGRLIAHRQAQSRYRQARAALFEAEPDLAWLGSQNPATLLAQPQALLRPGEVLLVTASLGSFGAVAQVIRANGDTGLVRLPRLASLAGVTIGSVEIKREAVGCGMRGVMRRTTALSALDRFCEELKQAFWTPVVKLLDRLGWLAELNTLIVITAPDHHSVPLDAANPGLRALYYCGLPAWLRQAAVPDCANPNRAQPTRTILFDQALATDRPIPFTAVEARLVQQVLSRIEPEVRAEVLSSRTVKALVDTPASHILLSCHGTLAGAGVERHGTLVLDAAKGLTLDAATASSLAAKASEILVSACVAGRVGRARWGDALGLVAQWQLQGVRAIVACTAPVADFYMPLLVALYWHHRVDQLPADLALRQAKRQLLSGEWPATIINAIRQVYADGMHEILLRAACANLGSERLVAIDAVGAWPLDTAARTLWQQARNDVAEGADPAPALVRAWRHSTERFRWIDPCLVALMTPRSAQAILNNVLQANIHSQLAHLCAVTVCYGTN